MNFSRFLPVIVLTWTLAIGIVSLLALVPFFLIGLMGTLMDSYLKRRCAKALANSHEGDILIRGEENFWREENKNLARLIESPAEELRRSG